MTLPRRISRGATARAKSEIRRRTPQSHDRVRGRARPGWRRREVEREPAPKESGRFIRGATKVLAKLIIAVSILAIFVFGVFPTGSFLEQRGELRDSEEELAELREENSQLEERIERLGSDAEIEREAREFGLVRPEEENYLIIAPGDQ